MEESFELLEQRVQQGRATLREAPAGREQGRCAPSSTEAQSREPKQAARELEARAAAASAARPAGRASRRRGRCAGEVEDAARASARRSACGSRGWSSVLETLD